MDELELGHPVWDGDNHYYEAVDAFSRHLDPAMASRCIEWCEINGRKYHVIGGKVSRAVANATFDPIAKPGCMSEYFRGNPNKVNPLDLLRDREPIREAYRSPEARIRTLDEQGLAGCWMFPTLGMIYEQPLSEDPVAVCHTFRAFNRWLLEDWGFDHEGRIISAPYLTLADGDWAVEELEWALDNGAQLLVMRAAAPRTLVGRVSPFDERFDPFWARINEAGVTVVVHAGDSGVSAQGYAPEKAFQADFKSGGFTRPSINTFAIEQAIHDYLLALAMSGLYQRFPNLRIASVENGAEFLGDLFRKLRSVEKKMPHLFDGRDPVELFREHVWINPFWEDDIEQIVEWMGADRVIFGSDWPHIEGLPAPLDYVAETKNLAADDRRKVLYDNVMELSKPRPA